MYKICKLIIRFAARNDLKGLFRWAVWMAGEVRCPGHGAFAYMERRILNNVFVKEEVDNA